jgi:hypothetical protein
LSELDTRVAFLRGVIQGAGYEFSQLEKEKVAL